MTDYQSKDLINSLQLSVDSLLVGVKENEDGSVEFHFESLREYDKKLNYFIQIMQAQKIDNIVLISKERALEVNWKALSDFLMLTRLNPDNMEGIAKLDSRYEPLIKNLKL